MPKYQVSIKISTTIEVKSNSDNMESVIDEVLIDLSNVDNLVRAIRTTKDEVLVGADEPKKIK